MESYLPLFDKIIEKQIEVLGRETAFDYATKAGLGLSLSGKAITAAGNPHTILMRLMKAFTATDNLAALEACTPLINDFLKQQAEKEKELAEQSQ
jgi:hypothetical protein